VRTIKAKRDEMTANPLEIRAEDSRETLAGRRFDRARIEIPMENNAAETEASANGDIDVTSVIAIRRFILSQANVKGLAPPTGGAPPTAG